MDEVAEIKNKLDIVEVIREYIPVKAVGANFQALCPFHHEKTPSFIISPDKQIWHCFGCDRGGDVFAFVMEKEALSFGETLRLLAPKAGVVLKSYNSGDYSKRNRILDIMELAGKYYSHILGTSSGQGAVDYLVGRGLDMETIKEWRLGVSPDSWDALYKFLRSRPKTGNKYTDEEISAAGLSLAKKSTSSSSDQGYFDRFRSRIMFPICDPNGNIIAFTARIRPENEAKERMGKYVNSPQTAVYDKSKVLFGLHKAKSAIRQEDLAIVVEGQMDVLACYQHGFKNVIASSGTALTADQVSLIKRFSSKVALLFDMDKAGQMAADRGIKEVLRQGMSLKIVILDGYKDPDECLNSKPADFKKALDEAKPMLEYYFAKVTDGLDLDNLENKMIVQDKMFAMIDLVPSNTEQGYWLKKISEELGFSEIDTREEFLKWKRKHSVSDKAEPVEEKKEEPVASESSREEKLAEACLSLLIKFPDLVSYSISNLDPDDFPDDRLASFYKNLIIHYNKSAATNYEGLRDYLLQEDNQAAKSLDKFILLGEKDFYDYEPDRARQELINIITELRRYSRQKKVQKLQQAIASAEADGRKEDLASLMEELKNLTIS